MATTFTNLLYHTVFSTKDRIPLIQSDLQERLIKGRFAWQTGYAAFTVSESQVSRVQKYLRSQESHHAKVDFKEELPAQEEPHRIRRAVSLGLSPSGFRSTADDTIKSRVRGLTATVTLRSIISGRRRRQGM